MSKELIQYICTVADNNLILGQRLGELCGHGPNIETDIALTNIGLDLFGQVRSYFQYAAKLEGGNSSEDTFAFLRKENEYKNVLLVEQPNTDFAYTIMRQFLYDVFHIRFMEQLQKSNDETLAAIAAKGVKEVAYHVRFSSDWVRRLGDGTEESHQRAQKALDDLYTYTEELFYQDPTEINLVEQGIAVDTSALKTNYYNTVHSVLQEATLNIPDQKYFLKGGKKGIHSEYMGYILTEMQYMQRTYPNMQW
jgi:ring-1,2-phenylacetyl-CoA epoxidase subunit PaaC